MVDRLGDSFSGGVLRHTCRRRRGRRRGGRRRGRRRGSGQGTTTSIPDTRSKTWATKTHEYTTEWNKKKNQINNMPK